MASKEKSMPDFKASKDRLTLLLVVMQLVTWSECSLTIWKVPRPLKVMLKWLCLCCINGTIKSVYTSVYNFVYWIVNPLLRTTTQKGKKKKKIPFKMLLFIDNAPVHPRVMYNETSVFMPTNTTSVLEFSWPWIE